MPKLDLTAAKQIKGPMGEILALKGPGFAWVKPIVPAGLAVDLFNHPTAGTLLEDYIGESGYSWTAITTGNRAHAVLENGYLRVGATSTTQKFIARNDPCGPVADQEVIANIRAGALGGNVNMGVAVRLDANGCYWGRYNAPTNQFQIYKAVSSNFTNTLLQSVPNQAGWNFSNGQVAELRLRAVGTTISMRLNGAEILSVTDNAIAMGLGGVRSSYVSGGTTAIASGNAEELADFAFRLL